MPTSAALLALTIISTSAGCRERNDPGRAYDQIALSIRHGDLKTAREEVDHALSRYGRKNLEWTWRFRIQKAQILASQSASADALAVLDEALPQELAFTDIAVRKRMFEGMAFRVAQNFKGSEEQLAAAEELANHYQPQLLCEVLNFKGALESDKGRYLESEATYNRALRLARNDSRPDQEASALVSLAWVATKREHFDEAVERGQAALQLSRSMGMQGLVATILGNTGWNYFELGDFESALDSYKQAVAASDQSGLTGYSFYWLTGVANSYRALHDDASAETILKDALGRARKLADTATITECLNALSEIFLKSGRLAEAAQENQDALQLEQAGLDHFGTFQSLILSARIDTNNRRFHSAEATLQKIIQDPTAGTPLRWEAQARLAKLYDDEELLNQAEREYDQSIDTIETARSSIDRDDLRVSFLSGAMEFYDDYVDFLVAHERSPDALKVAELSRARTLEEGLGTSAQAEKISLRNFRPEQIAQGLKATLLFYWLGEKHSHLWVVTAAKTTHLPLPSALEIDPVVKSYREALLGTRDPLETANPAGQKLYNMLVEPAKKLIPQGSRVIVLPDGSLYSLNFETLIVSAPKPHYWIEDVTITTGSSLTLLASAASRPTPKEKSLLLVGDTVQPNEDFPRLPQAPAEMKNVEKYFPESRHKVLSGTQATPASYLTGQPEKFAYLHFVTHGIASRARPLESAVVLSKEKDEDSYKLYAREILKRRLSAYLVTISACNGAGTRTYSGEGLVGLSWAFVRAGAHNVISALWEVSDTSTPQLMDALYGGLSRDQDAATALRAAKLSLLHSDSVYKKPFYWAPFQLYAGS